MQPFQRIKVSDLDGLRLHGSSTPSSLVSTSAENSKAIDRPLHKGWTQTYSYNWMEKNRSNIPSCVVTCA